jgi:predicted component of type VI protein secretion system
MRFRLRYLHHDLELAEGQFAVGRSAGCQLSLDDPLVSRQHAMFVVSKDGVTIEDLQSRNGVSVNGQRIEARTPLQVGDKVLIGSQELTLLLGRDGGSREAGSPSVGKRTLPRLPTATEPAAFRERTTTAPPGPPSTPPTEAEDSSMVRRIGAFSSLGTLSEKYLAMGRSDEAERLLAAPLADVMEATRAGKAVSTQLADASARMAAKLATATGKGAWADYVVELYSVQDRPCPAVVIDELYSAFRKVNAIDLVRLRAYIARLREKLATLGPAERFLLQRIEGLERLAALR